MFEVFIYHHLTNSQHLSLTDSRWFNYAGYIKHLYFSWVSTIHLYISTSVSTTTCRILHFRMESFTAPSSYLAFGYVFWVSSRSSSRSAKLILHATPPGSVPSWQLCKLLSSLRPLLIRDHSCLVCLGQPSAQPPDQCILPWWGKHNMENLEAVFSGRIPVTVLVSVWHIASRLCFPGVHG